MTVNFLKFTEDEFAARSALVENHLNANSGWAIGKRIGCLFETYGEEFEFVRRQDPRQIWTLIDGDDGDFLLVSGLRFVNRLGHLISQEPVPNGLDIQVSLESQTERPGDVAIGERLAQRR